MYVTKNTTQKQIKNEIMRIENALKNACLTHNQNAISIFNNELDYLYSFVIYDDDDDDDDIDDFDIE